MTNALGTGLSSDSRFPVCRFFRLVVAALTVLLGTGSDRLFRRHSDLDALLACRVRRAFERLGPTFVKAGQLMSSSAGPLPKAWMDEMAHCRDDVPAVPWDSVSQLIGDELGERRAQLLDMDLEPLAAGSMAQVYAAHLEDGTPVVVKIQRPGLHKVLTEDIRILRVAARLAIRFSPACAAANPRALVEDFAHGLEQQLSFSREAENAARVEAAVSSLGVRIPKVYAELSTDRVLVMDRLTGIRTDDAGAIDSAGLDRSKLVETIVAALLVPALGYGVFHGDMHPGNMLVLENGDLGLFDFGVVGDLQAPVATATANLLEALADRRYGDMVMAMFQLIDPNGIDLAALIPEVQALVAEYIDKPLATMDVREAIGGILELAARNDFALPDSLLEFFKQMLYISGICRTLDPEFDPLSDVAPIVALARGSHLVAA
jgi:ubiquinone biosynthesis protein